MLKLHPSDIEIGERHRALCDDSVARLAASIADIGLRHPITVRVVDEMMVDGHLTSGVPVLVAGAHRLAAAKTLGWQHIDCIEIDDDPVTAELWELAENLHRLDLTKEQRDEHIRRYAELLGRQRQVDGPMVHKPQGGRPQSVATEIAEKTGISRKTVTRAINRETRVQQPIDQLTDEEVIDRQVNAVMNAWNKASPEARAIIRDQIDTAVFDNTRAA